MSATSDWLSRLLDLLPVRGQLDVRCFYGAPWRITYERSDPGTIPYHIVVAGSAWLEVAKGGPRRQLRAGDIVLVLDGDAHVLSDGSGAKPVRAQKRESASVVVSENAGKGDRLDMMCGSFLLTPQHDRWLREYLPARLAVSAASQTASTARPGTAAQLSGLVELMRTESASENLGGRAMLNGLSTAMFALVLRLASESQDDRRGCSHLPAILDSRQHWPRYFMNLRVRGRCLSSPVSATCPARHSRVSLRFVLGVRPSNSSPTSA